MPQAGACVLAALKRARDDKVKELNANISIVEKLVDAMVDSQLKSPLEKSDDVPPTSAPPKQPHWADVAATPLQSPQRKKQTTHSHPSPSGSHARPMDRTASRHVFLRMNKTESANAFWSHTSSIAAI
ncbi:uncharacterized protein CTHT_0071630 [Thermochaetoides thermophila DSM 1495]|uniref:Uncharacterized protein n=1 Tax=Chaetomium thermophilum (strain DSM 1495 / CBS 144.50 / IMI 039719) TaxID=759272 RepID=G0SFP7_CHATD|nr:hypothetical protein CTHT_0071630 [Thermochaetoides thermophila DSM 1495]EGS17812.1 hypothetical protein CTHT_0071630 [Thermochaetoides thermophila DSM 1495]